MVLRKSGTRRLRMITACPFLNNYQLGDEAAFLYSFCVKNRIVVDVTESCCRSSSLIRNLENSENP